MPTDDDGVERTEDGRYIVVNGRRWRASDPSIPEKLRQELVNVLMAARRAVRTEGDGARHRVQDAKVALGERGQAWWETVDDEALRVRVAATARSLLRHREGTICPSDVARVVGGESWRERMDLVREVAFALADEGMVQVTRGGEPVARGEGSGPVRIARGENFPE
ncbi:DUF3253 domain-containing protein [Nocardioides yefusunii]|uniref:DUF3253 domain-containing protein n=1 Tax=Nocardioides yefusunii TaxID=2500546 RepID=A0ABW1QTM9_9ACTN|nr:DUF3253 domain-containing protein [Nocardioides yefusunii]